MVEVSTIVQVVLAVLLPNVGGWVAALAFNASVTDWYNKLEKPVWNPPAWVFAPAWTVFYCLMGYASYLVWRDGGGFKGAALPLSLYILQLIINWAWTPLFFGMESIKLGLLDFLFLIPSALACTYYFFKKQKWAGTLMIPYLLWLGYALSLNVALLFLN